MHGLVVGDSDHAEVSGWLHLAAHFPHVNLHTLLRLFVVSHEDKACQ